MKNLPGMYINHVSNLIFVLRTFSRHFLAEIFLKVTIKSDVPIIGNDSSIQNLLIMITDSHFQ